MQSFPCRFHYLVELPSLFVYVKMLWLRKILMAPKPQTLTPAPASKNSCGSQDSTNPNFRVWDVGCIGLGFSYGSRVLGFKGLGFRV